MDLLSLNDDVLLLLCTLLDRRDAFSFSIASKRTRQLAFKRTVACVECYSVPRLRDLTNYMLDSEPWSNVPRAHYVDELIIYIPEFQWEHSHPSEGLDILDGKPFEDRSCEISLSCQASSFAAPLLAAACNLRTLSIDPFGRLLQESTGAALMGMHRLAELNLYTVSNDAVAFLKSMTCDLRRLMISCQLNEDNTLSFSTTTLLYSLSSFRNLHTVVLRNFMPTDEDFSKCAMLSFPAVRHLHLFDASAPACGLIPLFPALHTFLFSLCGDLGNAASATSHPQALPPLRQVRVNGTGDLECLTGRLSTVDRLLVASFYPFFCDLRNDSWSESPTEQATLLAHLRTTRPISLYLGISKVPVSEPSLVTRTQLWPQMAGSYSRLRSLELQLRWSPDDTGDWCWLESMPSALAPLALACLVLLVPPDYPPRPYTPDPAVSRYPFDDAEEERQAALRSRTQEKDRVRVLGQLSQPFAETLSTLRILAIGDMGVSAEIMRATAEACDADDTDGEPEGLEDIMVDEWDDLRQLSCSRQTRWWRMEDCGAGGRKAIEVSEEEGERARALIEAPDWHVDTGLEGVFSTMSL